jgi:Tat protein secretion system quality control protein TatD with DNase activity
MMKKLLLFSLISLFGPNIFAQNEKLPIIDIHLHSYPSSAKFNIPNPNTGNILVTNADDHRKNCLKILVENNVVLGAVSSDGVPNEEKAYQSLAKWEKEGEIRILKGLWMPFGDSIIYYPHVDSVRKWFVSNRYDFLGELGFQYDGHSPSDTIFFKYYALAEELDVPVGIHTGMSVPGTPYTSPKFRLSLGNPYLLEDLLVNFPKLRVWAMHAGNQYCEEMVTVMHMYPQVYVDISPLSWLEIPTVQGNLDKFLRSAKEKGLLKRVMFGSDQMKWPEAIEMAINKIQSLEYLTDQEKADILYNNAARFLRLSKEEIAKHHGK